MGVLSDRRLEIVAQELARGKSPAEASVAAAYKPGTSFKHNARKRACRPDVKARVLELQRISGVVAAADSAYIQRKLIEITEAVPKMAIRPSDQIAALTLLARIIGALAPEKHDHTLNGLGDRLDAALARAAAA